jgi:hypothetical protein
MRAQDLAQGPSPSLAMASTFALAPFLIAGLPLLLAGTLGVALPWRRQRPWVPAAIVVGMIGLLLLMLAGPGFVISYAAPRTRRRCWVAMSGGPEAGGEVRID